MTPIDEIQRVLSPLRFEEFTRDYWGRRLLHQTGAEDRFAGLLTWEMLDAALREQPWSSPQLRVFQDGEPLPGARFLREEAGYGKAGLAHADAGAVAALLRGGCLLAISGAHHRFAPVRRLAAAFEYVFREKVGVNAYAACASSHGFPVHWDDHEVFVLQVSGRKSWRAYGRTVEAPLFRESHPDDAPPEQPLWAGDLAAGDFLYLPRGFWHVAEGLDEPTVHVTVGLDCVTGLDLLSWLSRELRSNALFRTDLPRLAGPEELRRHAARLREELLGRLEDAVVERFLRADDAAAPALSLGGIGVPAGGAVRWLPPRPMTVLVEQTLGRFLEFDALGREWRLPRWMEPVVRLLAQEGEVARERIHERLRGSLPSEDIDEAVQRLMVEGLAEEVKPPG